MRRDRAGVLGGCAVSLALLLGGCHSKSSATPENLIKGLNAHFVDHPECLFPSGQTFPYETADPVKTKQLDALTTSQLLKAERAPALHVSRYTTTPLGQRLAPRFCYGHRVATAIDSFTPPTPRNGFPETDAVYRYHLEDVPIWAQSQAMKNAFSTVGKLTSGEQSDKATLASTIAGWTVPD
jgi:hypothetical protein